MTRASRSLSVVLVTLLLVSMATLASAQSSSPLENLPYSGGVLMGRAIRAGRVQLPAPSIRPSAPPVVTCSPAPCTLPNTNVSKSAVLANETPIVINPKNQLQLLSGANDYACAGIQGFYFSPDGGTTWNRSCLGLLSGASGDGDPNVGFDLNNVAYAAGIDALSSGATNIVWSKSTDQGKTWSAVKVAVANFFSGGIADKPWMEIDTRPASSFKNNIYISVTQFATNNNSTITVSHSADGGATWSNAIAVDSTQVYPSVDQFSDMATGADGTVYVTWMRCTANGPSGDCGGTTATFYVSKSSDGGNTWTSPTKIATAALAPDPGFCCFYGSLPNTDERVSNIPVVAIDNSNGANNGTLYVTYYNWTGSFMQVLVTRSHDGGTTWTAGVPVAPSTATHDQFFQWLNVSPGGIVGVSWDDRRNDPSNINYESFAAFSNDGGKSFSKNFDLSAKPSNPFNDGFGGFFIGDYTGNAWVANNTLLVVYTDTTTGIDQDFMVGERLK
ncbi:MAG TPA: sialidase family protein [Terriglobales bacterium]|nr:sialidase family protein [Terriglobales bacterium]